MKLTYYVGVDYKEKICSVELSPQVTQGIGELFSDLRYIGETDESIRIDILRTALGRMGKDVEGEGPEEKLKAIWSHLEKLIADENFQEFENEYVLPEINRQKNIIDLRLRRYLLERLPPHVRRRFEEIENYDRRFPLQTRWIKLVPNIFPNKRDLQEFLNLSDTRFLERENEFLQELEKLAEPVVDSSPQGDEKYNHQKRPWKKSKKEAAVKCLKEAEKKRKTLIDVCRHFLSKREIPGEPNYEARLLANLAIKCRQR